MHINRRKFVKGLGIVGASAGVTGSAYKWGTELLSHQATRNLIVATIEERFTWLEKNHPVTTAFADGMLALERTHKLAGTGLSWLDVQRRYWSYETRRFLCHEFIRQTNILDHQKMEFSLTYYGVERA